jgi:hypothetical protein
VLICLDDYWNSGYGRIIMVPRVKLAYDKVSKSKPFRTDLVNSWSLVENIRWRRMDVWPLTPV